MRRFHGFLIDADNTIFDFDRSEKEAFYDTLFQFKIKNNLEQYHFIYSEINDKIWKELEEGVIRWDELKVERFRRFLERIELEEDPVDFSEVYLKNLSLKTYTLPHAIETLSYLSSRADLILGTNGISTVQRSRIARSEIEIFFKDIVISEEIGVSKPEPAFFDIVREKFNLPPHEILVVGDSLTSDIKGGRMAGFATCLYISKTEREASTSDSIKPDYSVYDLRELKDFAPDFS